MTRRRFSDYGLLVNTVNVKTIEVAEGDSEIKIEWGSGTPATSVSCLSHEDALATLKEIGTVLYSQDIKVPMTMQGGPYLINASTYEPIDLWSGMPTEKGTLICDQNSEEFKQAAKKNEQNKRDYYFRRVTRGLLCCDYDFGDGI
jgi:hypothetical protein